MKLYVDSEFASPYAMSAFVSLHEKTLSFDLQTVELSAKHTNSGFTSQSITRRVPLFVHDGFALSESSAISEYLDEIFPGTRLYPADPRSRATARELQAWIRSDLMALRTERPTDVVFYGVQKPPLSVQACTEADQLMSVAQRLLGNRSRHLFDEWCIADLDLALMLNRVVLHGDPVPGPLVDYAHFQWRRPAVVLWLNQPRPPL